LEKYLIIILFTLPLVGFLVLFENRTMKKQAGYIASGFSLAAFVLSVSLMFYDDLSFAFRWFTVGDFSFEVELRLDKIAKSMTLLVNFVALLVHVYSIKYMQGEKHYHKYFAYLGLFTFSMLGIVVFSNLLLIYAFWELVGLSSYLLIGFWYQRPLATLASKKAFILNRVGDIGFLVGILFLWAEHKTMDLEVIAKMPLDYSTLGTVVALCLFCGCIGKSAQFPLQVWLPDAMQGPTPASALIHAATMVAAGIYLMMRVLPLCTNDALMVIGLVGSFTAFIAALTAGNQFDIKKILAYSTISQLGYMVVGISTGKLEVAYLHLFSHAFFKAGLFLCVGAIIHEIEHHRIKINHKLIDPQDIRYMGGLSKLMPLTYWAYIACYISAIGLPFTSGFISKDFILSSMIERFSETQSPAVLVTLILVCLTAGLTTYYMTRQLILVFWGNYRAKENVTFHDTPLLMLVPVFILGLFSLFFLFSNNAFDAHGTYLLQYIGEGTHIVSASHAHEIAIVISILFTSIGVLIAYFRYSKKELNMYQGAIGTVALNHFYINKFYVRMVVPASLKISKLANKFDTKILDKSIDNFGVANVMIAHTLKILDQFVVDILIVSTKYIGTVIGSVGDGLQTKKVQNYLLVTLLLTGSIVYYIV
jgi:NADH-quinone oxidoreductase subunit L